MAEKNNGSIFWLLKIMFVALLLGLMGYLFSQATHAHIVFATKDEVKIIQIRTDKIIEMRCM